MDPESKLRERFKSLPEITALSDHTHGTHVSRESFMLPDRWALHFYQYQGVLQVDESVFNIHPGSVSLVPPTAEVTYYYQGTSQHLYCHFRSADNLPEIKTALFLSAHPYLALLHQRLHQFAGIRGQGSLHACVRLWDVLLEVIALRYATKEKTHAEKILTTATQYVGMQMSSQISISQLARHCGVSHNKFITVISDLTGQTPIRWLTHIRMDRAAELLAYSDLTIKVIAWEVGMPDLQHFNKSIRKAFGCSPRELRLRSRSIKAKQ